MLKVRASIFCGTATVAALLAVGCVPNLHRSIDPVARTVQGGREVAVSVTQSEIKAEIQQANGGQAFGLIGALIDVGVNNSRAADAEKTIQVVRESLTGFDFDNLALQSTKDTLAKINWFDTKDVSFGKEFTKAKRLDELDHAKAPQLMYTDYDYALSPDFSSVKITMVATLANKEVPPNTFPEERMDAGNLPYIQQFIAVVPLPSASKEPLENAKRWAESNGKMAREGLQIALADIQRSFEQSLTQSPDAAKTVDTSEVVSLAGFQGHVISKSEDGTLIRTLTTDYWVFVSTKAL